MLARRILYLTQHQMVAYRWKGAHLVAEGEFLPESATAEFAGYLAQNSKSLFSMVVNLGEEGFRTDTIPFLHARDRNAVISRRLGQNFLGAPLALAVSHGYESGTRKNEKLLLTALTSAELLNPWTMAMHAIGTRLQGIYSLPILSETLCQRLGLNISRGILVTVQDHSIRQSFFGDGRLLFSRVTPLAGESTAEIASNIATEANRFQQYLLSQRMLARGESLSAHILAKADAFAAIEQSRFNDGFEVKLIDLDGAAKKIGLKSGPTDSRAQNLFLLCALTSPPRQQFGTAALRQPYRIWRIGNALRASGALVFALCLFYAIKLSMDANLATETAEQTRRQVDGMEHGYRSALGSLPPIPMSKEVLRQLYERIAQLRKIPDSPAPALRALSKALDAMPQIDIKQLNWQSPDGKNTDSPIGGAGAHRPSVHSDEKESLQIKGSINLGAQDSPRLVMETFDALIRRIRDSGPEIEVTALQQPIDLNAGRKQSRADSAGSPRPARDFSLLVEFPRQP